MRSAEVDMDASTLVRGEVVDADGVPITEGALLLRCLRGGEVRVLGTVPLSDEGTFEGPGCRGQVCVTLKHPTQTPAEPWVLRPGSAGLLRTVSLERLWGEVQTPSGDPVEAARVSFVDAGPVEERDPSALPPVSTRNTITDADGRFSVAWIERPPCGPCEEAADRCPELPPMIEDLVAIANASGFASGRAAFDRQTVTEPDAPLRITVSLAEDLLTGQLLGPDGHAYARAFVLAHSLERAGEQRRAEVDPEGNFEIDGLGPGRHALRALQDGVELATAESDVGADVELEGAVSARGVDLEVVVKRADRRYAARATVDGGPFRGAQTDMKGRVRAASVLPGPLTLRVREGARTERIEVEIPPPSATPPVHPHRVEILLGPAAHDRLPPGL